jgi:flagellar basal-body rod modification protein FlgD
MLMAQLRAQDPMNPLQGHEYAAQLAQFSSVQELQAIQSSLDESNNMNLLMTQSINGNLAAALVGKTVRAQNNTVSINNSDADLRFSLGAAATSISVQVTDSEGNVVRTIQGTPREAGDAAVYWDGRDDAGNKVPAGDYTYNVTAADANGSEVSATTYIEGVVTAINYSGGGVTLTVNGQELLLGDIMSVMATESSSSGSGSDSATLQG